jgi:hypothetical protein
MAIKLVGSGPYRVLHLTDVGVGHLTDPGACHFYKLDLVILGPFL